MYEQAIAQFARRADSLDNAWRQYGTGCYKGRTSGGLDRAWFVVFNGRAAAGDVAPGCDRWFADFSQQAAEVAAGVIAAEEMARQADVYRECVVIRGGAAASTTRAGSGNSQGRPCYDRPVRIGIDARKLHDFGIGTYIRNLLRQLARLDHETEFVLLCRPEDAPALASLGANFRPVAETAGNYSVAEQLRIPLALRRERRDALSRAALRAAAARAAAGRS